MVCDFFLSLASFGLHRLFVRPFGPFMPLIDEAHCGAPVVPSCHAVLLSYHTVLRHCRTTQSYLVSKGSDDDSIATWLCSSMTASMCHQRRTSSKCSFGRKGLLKGTCTPHPHALSSLLEAPRGSALVQVYLLD